MYNRSTPLAMTIQGLYMEEGRGAPKFDLISASRPSMFMIFNLVSPSVVEGVEFKTSSSIYLDNQYYFLNLVVHESN